MALGCGPGRAWLLAGLSLVGAASVLLPPSLLDSVPELCLASRLGLPCAGHGLTHGFLMLGHGRWSQALRANPATPLVAAGLAWLWSRLLWSWMRSERPAA